MTEKSASVENTTGLFEKEGADKARSWQAQVARCRVARTLAEIESYTVTLASLREHGGVLVLRQQEGGDPTLRVEPTPETLRRCSESGDHWTLTVELLNGLRDPGFKAAVLALHDHAVDGRAALDVFYGAAVEESGDTIKTAASWSWDRKGGGSLPFVQPRGFARDSDQEAYHALCAALVAFEGGTPCPIPIVIDADAAERGERRGWRAMPVRVHILERRAWTIVAGAVLRDALGAAFGSCGAKAPASGAGGGGAGA